MGSWPDSPSAQRESGSETNQHAVEVADQKRSALSAHTYLGNSAHTQPASIEGQRSWTEQGVSRPLAQLALRPAGSRARAGGAAPIPVLQ